LQLITELLKVKVVLRLRSTLGRRCELGLLASFNFTLRV